MSLAQKFRKDTQQLPHPSLPKQSRPGRERHAPPRAEGGAGADRASEEDPGRVEVVREVLPLDTDLPRLLEPQSVQINAPQRIPSEGLRPFLAGDKPVLCLNPQKRVLAAKLAAVHEGHLVVDVLNVEAVKMLRWQREAVAVVFPVSPTQTFVLQTTVQGIYATAVHGRSAPDVASRPAPAADGAGHGVRHDACGPGADLRAVLHHQARRGKGAGWGWPWSMGL
jgi:hypothetical protein